jgi:hypothetical protein
MASFLVGFQATVNGHPGSWSFCHSGSEVLLVVNNLFSSLKR